MKITVVISVYNEENNIEACLYSLSKQNRLADEILIVDNNCTDRSMEIAQAFDVRIIEEAKQGIWAARATGYDNARGDVIVCTDADARFETNWLEVIEKSFIKNKNAVAIAGPGIFYDAHPILNTFGDWLYMKPYFFFVGLALGTKPLFGSNLAMRKSAWLRVRDSVHSDSEAVFDDIDLSYHLITIGNIRYDPAMAVNISIRPLKHPTGMIRRYKKGLNSVFIHWPEQSPWRLKVKNLQDKTN